MSKTHIVIPIGVGAPGTPVQEYLEKSVMSILKQTSKDFVLTIAADNNIPDRCKDFLEKNNVTIKWFEPFTYFRKGGIWKKIFDTWKEYDTEFVAFCHYDDIWDLSKLEIQTRKMLDEQLDGSWSESYIIDGNSNIIGPSDYSWGELTKNTVGNRTMAFAHTTIVSREKLWNSGILEHEMNWAANFEDIWALYIHKIKNIKKAVGAKFFWRNHDKNISNTVREEVEFVINQRNETAYSLSETFQDMHSIRFQTIVDNIKTQY